MKTIETSLVIESGIVNNAPVGHACNRDEFFYIDNLYKCVCGREFAVDDIAAIGYNKELEQMLRERRANKPKKKTHWWSKQR